MTHESQNTIERRNGVHGIPRHAQISYASVLAQATSGAMPFSRFSIVRAGNEGSCANSIVEDIS